MNDERGARTQAWLIVERLENWEVDKANNFSFFGLSERYRKTASEIKKDDLVFCYVSSGISAFSDIRLVSDATLRQLKTQSYNSAFANCFATAPVLVLARDKWIPIKDVEEELDLTRGQANWRSKLQTSIRRLSPHDATLLRGKLEEAAEKS